MAKRKNPAANTEIREEGPPQPAPAPVLLPEDGEIPDIVAAITAMAGANQGAEWEIRVYQVYGSPVQGMKEPYLFSVGLDQLPGLENMLATNYPAGGRFRVRVRRDNQLVKAINLDIAPRPGHGTLGAAPPRAVESQPTDDRGSPYLEKMMGQMMEMNMNFMRAVETRLAAIPQQTSPTDTLNTTMSLFKTFQEAMPKASAETSLEVLRQGIELGKMVAGNGDGEGSKTGILDIVNTLATSDIGKSIAEVLTAAARATPAPVASSPAPAAIAPARPMHNPRAPAPAQPAPGPQAERQQLMRQGMDFLFAQASAGADPMLLVEQVVAVLPADVMEELTEVESPVDWLQERFPRVAQHRPWFQALVDAIFEEGDNEGEGEAGDDGEQHRLETTTP